MYRQFRFLIILVLLATSPSLHADTMYVIDKLVLGMHEGTSPDSDLVKALPTGTPLEVLEHDGKYARVRAPDGSSGWVDAGYLMKDKPAQIVILELEDKFRRSNDALDKANKSLKKMRRQVSKLEQQTATAKPQIPDTQLTQLQDENASLREQLAKASTAAANAGPDAATQAQISALTAANTALQQRIDNALATLGQVTTGHASSSVATGTYGSVAAWKWLAVTAIIALIIGIIGGVVIIDRMNLKRHGGFRL